MKKLLLLSLFFLAGYVANAQGNAMEAKAAYLLAEESYSKGDMHAALDYINEATAKLGTANAKISYLKVMILKEISTKDTAAVARLDSAILAFEKAPDVADFAEEKILEITKLKIERKRTAAIQNERKKYSLELMEENMRALEKQVGWWIGMPLDTAMALHKDRFDEFFKNSRHKKNKIGPDDLVWMSSEPRGVIDIAFRNGQVASFDYYLHNLFENSDFEKSRPVLKRTIDDLVHRFGPLPEPTLLPGPAWRPESKISRYTWTSKTVTLWLDVQEAVDKTIGWAVYKMHFSANNQLGL